MAVALEPLVVQRMREFRELVIARESIEMQAMARRWVEIENALMSSIENLADRFADEQPTPAQLFQMDRYRELLSQTQQQVDGYAEWAAGEIAHNQATLARWGVAHAQEAIQLTYFQAGAIGVRFDRLPVEAVEIMIGLAGDGAPIGDLLRDRMVRDAQGNPLPGVWDRLTRTLVEGTALGRNPRDTARRMRDDLAGGLNKALTIARTEQLRVYREAGVQSYRESGVVRAMKRLAAHDGRVCPACLAEDGKIYPLDEAMTDHPQGRCTGVPLVEGLPDTTWLAGEAWLRQQDEGIQRSILRGGYWQAWRDGEFAFADLATTTRHPVWGGGLQVTPLGSLVS